MRSTRVGTLAVGDDFDRAAGGSAERVEPRETAEDVLVYTSGTTALPKGVVYTRATQVTSVFVPQMAVGYDPSDRFLLFTPLAHRAAQPLLLCALFMGATTRLLTEYSPAALVSAIRDRGVTALVAVPTALKDILGLRRAEELGPMPGVRHVFLSGESVGSHLLEAVSSSFPNARFSSAYGSTEAGLVTFLDHEDQLEHPRSCGRALQGVEIRLVDDDGSEVGTGEPGEILVRAGEPGTYTVAAGYLGPDGVESFTDADGWFHTGDVATCDEDGFYSIVDRKKDMILSGGMNIASKEVEEIIAAHPDVVEVAVTGEPDARFGERVVAWVVRRPDATIGDTEIVGHVASRAASYKKPRAVQIRRRAPAVSDREGAQARVAHRCVRPASRHERSAMNIDELVAIDIHTHAKIPLHGDEDPLTKRAAARGVGDVQDGRRHGRDRRRRRDALPRAEDGGGRVRRRQRGGNWRGTRLERGDRRGRRSEPGRADPVREHRSLEGEGRRPGGADA